MEDEFGKDDKMAVFCTRLSYIQQGLRLVHLLDMKGRDTHATLLVRFTIEDTD
jgi:phosphatidylinositol phospholipase C delta